MDVQPELCAIFKTPVDKSFPFSIPYAKGSSAINQASIARNDQDKICTMPGDVVHQECCRKYCHPHQIAKRTHQEEQMPSTSSM